MEEVTLNLARVGDGRPLLVTQPLGEAPRVTSVDKVDRTWVQTQRHSAVLTGAFSCCRMKHQLTSKDGHVTIIPCDKDRLEAVLLELHEKQRQKIFAQLAAEGLRGEEFEKRISLSLKKDGNASWNYFNHQFMKPLVLTRQLEDLDWVQLGWSKPFEELTYQDYERFTATFDATPQTMEPKCALFYAATQGHLPMAKYLVDGRPSTDWAHEAPAD